jgi:hypothetical protein
MLSTESDRAEQSLVAFWKLLNWIFALGRLLQYDRIDVASDPSS